MKIVVVSFSFFPEVDGVANAAGQMVDIFVDAGHEVHVVTGRSQLAEGTANDRFTVHRFGVYENGFWDSKAAQSYTDFLISYQASVTIFHCWGVWTTDIAIKHFTQISGKKILLSHGYGIHEIHWYPKFPWGLWSWLKRLPDVISLPYQMASFDQVVFLSTKTNFGRFFDSWIAHEFGFHNITVIPNAVNNSTWGEIPPNFKERYGFNPGTFFLSVANYNAGKNQLLALEAFCEADIPNSSLVFIGSDLGEYGTKVFIKWQKLKDSHPYIDVHFFEGLDRSQVISAIKSCDIFLLLSKLETQPICLLEAMSCGKPFISTDTGCVSEMEGGILASSKNEIVIQMKYLADQPAEVLRIGNIGRICFEINYSISAYKRAWLDLIEKIT